MKKYRLTLSAIMATLVLLDLSLVLPSCALSNGEQRISMDANGNVSEIENGYYQDGKFIRHGTRIICHPLDEKLKLVEVLYRHNVPVNARGWYANGFIRSESLFDDQGRKRDREVIYNPETEGEIAIERYYKDGKPWDGVFIMEEVVDREDCEDESEYYLRHDHPDFAIHTYKAGELISNSNPKLIKHAISFWPEIPSYR